MVTVHDVASYVLRAIPSGMSTMKLQKLVYFAQGWSLAFLRKPLFEEQFQAWRRGPVCAELFELHRGRFSVDSLPAGRPEALDAEQRVIVDAVLRNYSGMTGVHLSELSHVPDGPWAHARRAAGAEGDAASRAVIDRGVMEKYFREALGLDGLAPGME